MEPYKIKITEALTLTGRGERETILKAVDYNPYLIPSKHVIFDLLADSGMGSMSTHQWAALVNGDESYAGATSFNKLESVAKEITGYSHILPLHQGRAAEDILFQIVVKEGTAVVGNGFLDVTRMHVQRCGATAVDMSVDASKHGDFNGNINVQALEKYILRGKPAVSLVYISVTSHTNGGQPVSLTCLQGISEVCRKHCVSFYLSASRWATNCWFIKLRDRVYERHKPIQIAKEIFSLCDGCILSARKDGSCNTGAIFGSNIDKHIELFSQQLILKEGFLTYGGMTGRDMEVSAVGLIEALDERYLRFRIDSLAAFGEMLKKKSVPIVEPVGGYAVCIDAGTALSHLDGSQHPAWAFNCAIFLEGGIRGTEDGTVMNSSPQDDDGVQNSKQYLRLAIPSRTYTQLQLQHMSVVIGNVVRRRTEVSGMRLKETSGILRHFTAKLEPLNREMFPEETMDSSKPVSSMPNGYRRT